MRRPAEPRSTRTTRGMSGRFDIDLPAGCTTMTGGWKMSASRQERESSICGATVLYAPAMAESAPNANQFDLPWGTTPEGEFDRNGVAAAAVLGTAAIFLTFPLGIVGIVLSCMGLDRIRTEPAAA